MKTGFSIKLILYVAPKCPRRIVAPNCPTPNCPRRIVRAELSNAKLSAPNCARRIVLRRIVRTPVYCACFASQLHEFFRASVDGFSCVFSDDHSELCGGTVNNAVPQEKLSMIQSLPVPPLANLHSLCELLLIWIHGKRKG